MILYVDNILLATNDFGLLHETKKFLSKNLEMKYMDETSYVMNHKDCLKKHALIKF